MARKQTRRSISLRRELYDRLQDYCESNNISMSSFVELRINEVLDIPPESVTFTQPAVPVDPTSGKFLPETLEDWQEVLKGTGLQPPSTVRPQIEKPA